VDKPSKSLLLAEWRWMLELGFSVATLPALLAAKRGDGHPVLVLPGFLASDRSTEPLRRYLRGLGYDTHGWGLGRSVGGVFATRDRLRTRLNAIARTAGRRVSLVGWSLGGIYARELALDDPARVRSVITLGTPFAGDLSATNAHALYEFLTGESPGTLEPAAMARLAGPLAMPATSIYSKTDGIVNWRTSLVEPSPRAENVEVLGSHLGLGVNPAVLWAIADRLAQPEGTFVPFAGGGPFAFAYPRTPLARAS